MTGHTADVTPSTLLEALGHERSHVATERAAEQAAADPAVAPTFSQIYEAHFDFVWRSARRLGATQAHVDDVVQETFMVVHRRLPEFEGRSSIKTWLFGITRRVVSDHHRSARRRPVEPIGERDPAAPRAEDPEQRYGVMQGQALLHALLDQLDRDKREVFVLAELEQMSGPEIASALDLNLNTMHARLRAARREFEQALARHAARHNSRTRQTP